MLNVYSALWCSHCQMAEKYLKENNIEFTSINIEAEPEEVVKKVIEVNGGDDWVVPTLEYKGKWRPGKVFNAKELKKDLIVMGVLNR